MKKGGFPPLIFTSDHSPRDPAGLYRHRASRTPYPAINGEIPTARYGTACDAGFVLRVGVDTYKNTVLPLIGQKPNKKPALRRVIWMLPDFLKQVIGGEDEDRTHDLRIANAALSQLSYPPTSARFYIIPTRLSKRTPRPEPKP